MKSKQADVKAQNLHIRETRSFLSVGKNELTEPHILGQVSSFSIDYISRTLPC